MRCPASSMKRHVRRRDWRSRAGVMGLGVWRQEGRWFSSKVEVERGTRGMEDDAVLDGAAGGRGVWDDVLVDMA